MLPSLATLFRSTSPHRPPFMLLGRVGQPSTSRYGLGSSVGLGKRVSWACATAPNIAITTVLTVRGNPARPASGIWTHAPEYIRAHRISSGEYLTIGLSLSSGSNSIET